MKILITGGTGLLGKALIENNSDKVEMMATFVGDYDMKNTDQVRYQKLDIRDKDGYLRLFREFQPEVTIHTASIGSPDYAEKNKEETWEVNVGGTQNILSLCEEFDSKFIYISSNGIYDGNKAPYGEKNKAEPINYYGQVKLEGEKVTKKAKVSYAIVRPILMYGWNHPFERTNIITLALSKLQKGETMYVYEDVYTNPLFALSCAEAIWKLIGLNKFETFNIAGKDRISVYEFVKKAAQIFGLSEKLVIPVKQGYFNELVPRPKDTSYNTEKMQRVLKLEPLSVSEGLSLMKRSHE